MVYSLEIHMCDSIDAAGTHSIIPNQIGGFPHECVNRATGNASWSTAAQIRAFEHFNDVYPQRHPSHDLYARFSGWGDGVV